MKKVVFTERIYIMHEFTYNTEISNAEYKALKKDKIKAIDLVRKYTENHDNEYIDYHDYDLDGQEVYWEKED